MQRTLTAGGEMVWCRSVNDSQNPTKALWHSGFAQVAFEGRTVLWQRTV
jgi:hypothetical protein